MPKERGPKADRVDLDSYLAQLPVFQETSATDLIDVHELERDPEFVADYLKGQLVEDILKAMEKQGITKSDLAKRLNKSRQYVTKVLNEKANFTIETIAEVACALGTGVSLRLHSLSERMLPEHQYSTRNLQKVRTNKTENARGITYAREEADE
jgi:transcriptional regulator with XRE-family HTH domain